MKVFVFGNELVKEDSLALTICRLLKEELPDVEFIECNQPEVLLEENEITIVDVVKGISDLTIFDDPSVFKEHNIVSLHDFDLSFFLKLMQKSGKLSKLKIIGLPMQGNGEELKKKVYSQLTSKK